MAAVLDVLDATNNPPPEPGAGIYNDETESWYEGENNADSTDEDDEESILSPSEVPDGFQTLNSVWWLRHRSPRFGPGGEKSGNGASGGRSGKDKDAKSYETTVQSLQEISKKSRSNWRQASTLSGIDKTRRKAKSAKSKTARTTKGAHPHHGRVPPKVLRIPPRPPPLPPCLQCVLAGVSCSLTLTPYAKGYANDRTDPDQRLTPAARSWCDALTSYALLVQELNETCDSWELFISVLSRRRQTMEQRFLKQAIVRGATDSPFLLPPPAQCARCLRDGELACLQQTADLTQEKVERPGGVPAAEERIDVAWFASSGPPPLSLLPQHAAMIMDQIRFGHHEAAMASFRRHHAKNPRRALLPLEAVFCRDPRVLSASQVLAKAQILLKSIADSKKKKQAAKAHRYSDSLVHGSARYLEDLKRLAADSKSSGKGTKQQQQEEGHARENEKEQRERGSPALEKPEVDEAQKEAEKKQGEAKGQENGQENGQEQEQDEGPTPTQPKQDLVRQTVWPATLVEVARMQPRWNRLNVYAGRGVAAVRKLYADRSIHADDRSPVDVTAEKPPTRIRGPRETLPFWDPSTMMSQPRDEAPHERS